MKKNVVVYKKIPDPILAELRARFNVTYYESINDSNRAQFNEALKAAHDVEERLANYPVLDEFDLSKREQERACEVWKGCYSEIERLDYIRRRRNDFEFRSFADLMGCVRGKYFAGDAASLIGE